MTLTRARENMLKQQVRTGNISNPHLLAILAELPREKFVPPEFVPVAYMDVSIPLGSGEAMFAPGDLAKIVQALNVTKKDKVLVVGIESGFTAAVLASLAKHVDVVDRDPSLLEEAKLRFKELNIDNIDCIKGDASAGWAKSGQYNVIIITGSLPFFPQGFRKNLAREGRIFAIIGKPPAMAATLLKRVSTQWVTEKLFETSHPRLPNVAEPENFTF